MIMYVRWGGATKSPRFLHPQKEKKKEKKI